MDSRYIIVAAPAGFDGVENRRHYYFKTKNAALEFRNRIKRWKAERKAPTETLSFDESAKRWLAYLQVHVGNLELLPEIIGHWERTAKAITEPLTVKALAESFVLYRETKKLRRGTLAEDRYVARRLSEVLGEKLAHELTTREIRTFLSTASSESTERKLYKVAFLVFEYAKEQRIVMLNPFSEIKRPEVSYVIPGILQPAEFKRLLRAAEEKVRDLVPFLALAGFAGIRRDELVKEYANDSVLQWSDVDWTKKLITVRDGVAKQTRRKLGNRRFLPMEPALVHWLLPYRQDTGPIVLVTDGAFRRRMQILRQAAKIHPPTNSLRHSFASHWLARTREQGVGELAKRMGNSEAICKRHYLETLSREEGRAWFALRRRPKPRIEALPSPSVVSSAPRVQAAA
jgi:site-specific recombinase XerD